MSCRLEVPMTPFLGWFNLLELLTELKETFYLLDYWFITKIYNYGTNRWKRCLGKTWVRAQNFHALCRHAQFSSVAQSCPTLCDPMNHSTPGLPVITNSRSSLKLTSIESVMPSSHLTLCRPLLLLPPIPSSIRVFSNE